MQIHIRPFKTVDAAELQSAVLESVGHIGPWLDWATPRYSLTDARDWVSESRTLWARQSTYRWLITDAQSRSIYGSVEISRQLLGGKVGRMGYWLRRQALGKGICSRAGKAALDYVFHRGYSSRSIYISTLQMSQALRLRENSERSCRAKEQTKFRIGAKQGQRCTLL